MTSKVNFQTINRQGAAQSVADQMMDLIFAKELLPGHELPSEGDLAGLFGVGKSSVREALRSLEALGVVDIRHGKRAVVRQPSSEAMAKMYKFLIFSSRSGLDDILEFRSILETEAVVFAAQRRTEEQLKAIKDALDTFVESLNGPQEVFIDNDMLFHISIAEAVGNIVLSYTLHAYREVIRESIQRLFIPLEQRSSEGLLKRHVNIYECIAAKDPAGAKEAMQVHFGASGILQARNAMLS